MSHRTDSAEQWALRLINQIITRSELQSDALPGEALRHIKRAKKVLVNHQKRKNPRPRPPIKE